jgi:hypothetical protein
MELPAEDPFRFSRKSSLGGLNPLVIPPETPWKRVFQKERLKQSFSHVSVGARVASP